MATDLLSTLLATRLALAWVLLVLVAVTVETVFVATRFTFFRGPARFAAASLALIKPFMLVPLLVVLFTPSCAESATDLCRASATATSTDLFVSAIAAALSILFAALPRVTQADTDPRSRSLFSVAHADWETWALLALEVLAASVFVFAPAPPQSVTAHGRHMLPALALVL